MLLMIDEINYIACSGTEDFQLLDFASIES